MSRDSPDSPDLFENRRRQQREAIIVDSDDDDDTRDAFPDAQNFDADEEFDQPASPPPGQVSPPYNDDYFDRVERECRGRETDENERQLLTPGYMNNLRGMFNQIDEWLAVGGGQNPIPMGFKRFTRHNWTVRLLPIEERIRVSKIRLRIDTLILEEIAHREGQFWERVELAEHNVGNLSPSCTICRFDLRNEEFEIFRLICGHTFHDRCINRHLQNNNNPRCPNCNAHLDGGGERVQLNYH